MVANYRSTSRRLSFVDDTRQRRRRAQCVLRIGRFPVTVANEMWQIAGSATETVVDGGARRAQVAGAEAAFYQQVATYRQTVLIAFQQVEDQLSNLRILARQQRVQDEAVALSRRAVEITLNEYRAGTVAFTTVVTAQATLLLDEEDELTARQNLFVASAALIEALGGGWDTTLLPTQVQLSKGFSLLPKLEPPPPTLESPDAPARSPQATQ